MILVQFLTRESSDAPGQMLIITAARLMDCLSPIQLKGTQAFLSIFIGWKPDQKLARLTDTHLGGWCFNLQFSPIQRRVFGALDFNL